MFMVARMGVVGVAILGVVALGGFVYLFFLGDHLAFFFLALAGHFGRIHHL